MLFITSCSPTVTFKVCAQPAVLRQVVLGAMLCCSCSWRRVGLSGCAGGSWCSTADDLSDFQAQHKGDNAGRACTDCAVCQGVLPDLMGVYLGVCTSVSCLPRCSAYIIMA